MLLGILKRTSTGYIQEGKVMRVKSTQYQYQLHNANRKLHTTVGLSKVLKTVLRVLACRFVQCLVETIEGYMMIKEWLQIMST